LPSCFLRAPARKIIAWRPSKPIVIDKAGTRQTVRLTDFDEKDLMDGDIARAVVNVRF